jgi:hypothetical protein
MKKLRLFFFCVMAIVLPVNAVLANMPMPIKVESAHAAHHHEEAAPVADVEKPELHLHLGLFGKVSEHWHEPMPVTTVDCAKACQTMANSVLFDSQFALPIFLSSILVEIPHAALYSVTLAPPEDPPKFRA